MGFFAVLAASLFAVFLFTVFGGYSLLLWCQQSLWMIVPPAVVLAVLVWAFLKMDDKIQPSHSSSSISRSSSLLSPQDADRRTASVRCASIFFRFSSRSSSVFFGATKKPLAGTA